MRLANTIVTTLRPSRAWVHSDCSVYIALPSPTMQITLRSGHATAAPVATGVENPIEPPMFCSQSCGAAAAGGGKKARAGGGGSGHRPARFGYCAQARGLAVGRLRVKRARQRFQRGDGVFAARGHAVNLA